MALECPHCGKKYRVESDQLAKLPPAIRCKACKGVIKIPKKTEAVSESGEEVRILVCSDCGKRYRVPAAKIPSGRDAVPCKACGGSVPLIETESSPMDESPAYESDEDAGEGSVDRDEEERVPIYRNVWFLAGCGVAFLVVLGIGAKAFLFTGDTYSPPPRPPVARDTVSAEPDSSPMEEDAASPMASAQNEEPFLGLTANVPLILNEVQLVLQEANEPNMELMMTVGMIQALDVNNVSLLVAHQGGETLLPSLCVQMTNPVMLEQMVAAKQGPAAFMIPVETGVYALDMSQMPPEAGQSGIPLEDYRLHFSDGWVVAGPKETAEALVADPGKINAYKVTQFVETLGSGSDLMSISLALDPGLYGDWEERMEEAMADAPPGTPNPITPERRQQINQFIAQLKMVERIALAFNVSDQGQREIFYRQQFAAGVDGTPVYQALNQGNLPVRDPNDMLTPLLNQAVLQNPVFNRTINLQDNLLTVRLDWAKEQDEQLVGVIMMLGMSFNFGGSAMGPVAPPGGAGPTP